MFALWVFLGGRFFSAGNIGEKIVGIRGVQKILGKTALRRGGLEVVLVFRKIFGHGDQLSSDVVPGLEHCLRGTGGGLDRRLFLGGVLGGNPDRQNCRE